MNKFVVFSTCFSAYDKRVLTRSMENSFTLPEPLSEFVCSFGECLDFRFGLDSGVVCAAVKYVKLGKAQTSSHQP